MKVFFENKKFLSIFLKFGYCFLTISFSFYLLGICYIYFYNKASFLVSEIRDIFYNQ